MVHQISLTRYDVQSKLGVEKCEVTVEVRSVGKTGVEMEALHGVSVALLVIWDMVKIS